MLKYITKIIWKKVKCGLILILKAFIVVCWIDKPTAPQGPLEVLDVFKDRCRLQWRPPKDDGGEPVDHYLVEKQDTSTGKWEEVRIMEQPCFCYCKNTKKSATFNFYPFTGSFWQVCVNVIICTHHFVICIEFSLYLS